MLSCSFLAIYAALRALRLPLAGPTSIGLLCWTLSTGLPQAFNSENVCFFLTSVLLYSSVRLYAGDARGVRFWAATLVIATATGLLVLTRMIPLLFIPGLTWLMWDRVKGKQLLTFGGAVSLLTAAMLLWLVWTNHDRFGRFELTDSNGRHLWQGAKEMAPRALSGVPEYEALKRVAPEIDGAPKRLMPLNDSLDYWDVPYPDQVPGLEPFQTDMPRDGQKDALLKTLAIEAIRSRPVLYVASGALKFLRTIGEEPYQLGFLYRPGFYDPLQTSEPMPPLSSVTGLVTRDVGERFRKLLDLLHALSHVAYPLAIGLIATSLVGMGAVSYLSRVPRAQERPRGPTLRSRGSERLNKVVFVIGVLIIAIACLARGSGFGSYLGFVLGVVMVGAQTRVLARFGRRLASGAVSDVPFRHQRLYACLACLFFGSMWLSWQLEVALSRYTIPYIPLLAIMLGIAVAFWRTLSAEVRSQAHS